jgi:hypothetical protein
VTLKIDGKLVSSKAQSCYSHRTLFGDLPRSLPPSCMQIQHINVTNLRFKNVHQMLFYLRSLPRTCERVDCENLALEEGWKFELCDIALLARRWSPGRLRHISVTGCEQHWPFVWLLLDSKLRGQRNPGHTGWSVVYVHQTEVSRLLSIVQALSSTFYTTYSSTCYNYAVPPHRLTTWMCISCC